MDEVVVAERILFVNERLQRVMCSELAAVCHADEQRYQNTYRHFYHLRALPLAA